MINIQKASTELWLKLQLKHTVENCIPLLNLRCFLSRLAGIGPSYYGK